MNTDTISQVNYYHASRQAMAEKEYIELLQIGTLSQSQLKKLNDIMDKLGITQEQFTNDVKHLEAQNRLVESIKTKDAILKQCEDARQEYNEFAKNATTTLRQLYYEEQELHDQFNRPNLGVVAMSNLCRDLNSWMGDGTISQRVKSIIPKDLIGVSVRARNPEHPLPTIFPMPNYPPQETRI